MVSSCGGCRQVLVNPKLTRNAVSVRCARVPTWGSRK
ncbi:zinc finger domain-containing protein [uncultured Microbacterium sp.]